MTSASTTISLRLPPEARARLDAATRVTRRSRSALMQEALERHLNDIVEEKSQEKIPERYSILLSLAGAGKRSASGRSAAEIDKQIRWLRDDD